MKAVPTVNNMLERVGPYKGMSRIARSSCQEIFGKVPCYPRRRKYGLMCGFRNGSATPQGGQKKSCYRRFHCSFSSHR